MCFWHWGCTEVKWNESAMILSAFEYRLKSRLSLTHHANKSSRWAEYKHIKWFEGPWTQSGRKGKGLWRKGFAEKPSLKFRMKDWTSKRRCKSWLPPLDPGHACGYLRYRPLIVVNSAVDRATFNCVLAYIGLSIVSERASGDQLLGSLDYTSFVAKLCGVRN